MNHDINTFYISAIIYIQMGIAAAFGASVLTEWHGHSNAAD